MEDITRVESYCLTQATLARLVGKVPTSLANCRLGNNTDMRRLRRRCTMKQNIHGMG